MPKNPKQIPDPDNEGQMIDNPDYDPTLNEDGTPIEREEDNRTDLQKQLDEMKADFKKKLDKVYAERDAEKAEKEKLAKAERDREIQKLKDEGKLKEAHEAELADLQAQLKSLTETNTKLSRDNEVRDVLSDYEFKNVRARQMAQAEIVADLIKDDNGVWKHKSGVSIKEFAETFFKSEDNQFLLKSKRNSGSGTSTTPPAPVNDKKPTSLFDMKPEDVMANILAGKGARG